MGSLIISPTYSPYFLCPTKESVSIWMGSLFVIISLHVHHNDGQGTKKTIISFKVQYANNKDRIKKLDTGALLVNFELSQYHPFTSQGSQDHL